MTDLILHVGMDKTGTTAIQYALHAARKALLTDCDVLVPKTGIWRDHSHHPFAFAALETVGMTHKDLAVLFSDLKSEIASARAGTVLISSECLFKLPHNDLNSPFFDHVARLFDTVTIVVYVRRQDHWVESRHRHSIVSGRELTIDQLLRPQFCDYKRFIDLWADRYGAANLVLRPYEREQFVGGDITLDLLAAVGIAAPKTSLKTSRRKNVSFHYKDVLFRAAVNHLNLPPDSLDDLNRFLLARSHRGDPDRQLISPNRALYAVTHYAAMNADLVRTYPRGPSAVLFQEAPPEAHPDTVPIALSVDECRVVMDELTAQAPGIAALIRKGLAAQRAKKGVPAYVLQQLQNLAEAAGNTPREVAAESGAQPTPGNLPADSGRQQELQDAAVPMAPQAPAARTSEPVLPQGKPARPLLKGLVRWAQGLVKGHRPKA